MLVLVANARGPLGWDLSPHQHWRAAERKNQWEALMLKKTNKKKLKLNFKAPRHLWELFISDLQLAPYNNFKYLGDFLHQSLLLALTRATLSGI